MPQAIVNRTDGTSPVADPAVLRRNLDALGPRNGAEVRRIEQATASPSLEITPSADGAWTGRLDGRRLCSGHQPIAEAARLVDEVDLVEHAVFLVHGFGLGWHVKRLAERLDRRGVIIVLEPDVAMLRGVLERIDHSDWLGSTPLLLVTDPEDRAGLACKLDGTESIVGQGVAIVDHPASRARLEPSRARFAAIFSDFVRSTNTTLLTTLIRSTATVRNLLLNVDHYVDGPGIEPLAGAFAGKPGIIVSAGPSLHRNLHLLAEPGVRDRCAIIAVQTTLKPLLSIGVAPHFVTALDYHEISVRFYEGLDSEALRETTLVADPKVHPSIPDVFPGQVRCSGSPFLDRVLGPAATGMGSLPAGATVAHLAVYLADHLGCDPIVLIGQDLGFTDGLYYGPGTAIHDVWSPELNSFSTIEMMEWQRIARHRTHLQTARGADGRPVLLDGQMLAYLRQFERDFARFAERGVRVIDATEGGVAKQHTETSTLRAVLEAHLGEPLPSLPDDGADPGRRSNALARIARLRTDVQEVRRRSLEAETLCERMLRDQHDAAAMSVHFDAMDACQAAVGERLEVLDLLNQVSQLAAFRRLRADRRVQMHDDLNPLARQRMHLERDLDNVRWMADAAAELDDLLHDAAALLEGRPARDPHARRREERSRPAIVDDTAPSVLAVDTARTGPARLAAVIPIDPEVGGLGQRRRLDVRLDGRTVLARTCDRLRGAEGLERLVLLAPRGLDVAGLLDDGELLRAVEIEWIDGSPRDEAQRAVDVARRWSRGGWRGGITGATIFDEIPGLDRIDEFVEQRGLDGVVLAAPDWPLVGAADEHGLAGVIARITERADDDGLVLSQGPPGLAICALGPKFLRAAARGQRIAAGAGGRLRYDPRRPQHDLIASDRTVRIDHRIRDLADRLVADAPGPVETIDALLRSGADADPAALAAALDRWRIDHPAAAPTELELEPTARRDDAGLLAERLAIARPRPDLDVGLAERLLSELPDPPLVTVTFGGIGEPLLHPELPRLIDLARAAGVGAIHVRTSLRAGPDAVDRLVAAEPDVVSIDLHADRAATYLAMFGDDRFRSVLESMQRLITGRRALPDRRDSAAAHLPWIVPRLARCDATLDDLDAFYDRWVDVLGAAVIEPLPPAGRPAPDRLLPVHPPASAVRRAARTRMLVHADGRVPVDEHDLDGTTVAGSLADRSLTDVWTALRAARDASIDASTWGMLRP